ncbi:GNAT family N-acetyltransferase [Tessaracoccus flavus]|uniref:Uncharacterized protein n=1 Tax=Tessaracoccus flavus TaxID=1610493 RepID=A0A1Q2CEF2_9ACTN|nr:GNAT family N-acetyltransferase [Tessaracoccus flavus]AQP44477.1 hypothetical protein RPIT_06340 [Tessaracoccus flavus]SDY70607.1 Acetyltransferase (GNAT) family protein [Tessaracoccus flavus]
MASPHIDAYVEPHLSWRTLGPDDADELDHFRTQLEALDNSVLAGIAEGMTGGAPAIVPGQAVGGWDHYDSLSAYGLNYISANPDPRAYLMGGVHPTHRHLGIGTSLFRWQIAQAISWRDEHHPGRPLWLGSYAELGRPGLDRVARHYDFTPERYYYDLHRDLTVPIPLWVPEGVRLAPFVPQASEAVRRLHNICSQPLGGAEVTEDVWADRLCAADFRPDWSFLATVEGRVVGYAMSGIEEGGGGWTERFGVDPAHRGRGISLALLASCLRAMRDSGCTEAGIGIDTPDGVGVQRLAAELGYTTRDAVALLSKVVT